MNEKKKIAVKITTINIPYVINDLKKILEKKKYTNIYVDIIIAGDKKTPRNIYSFIKKFNLKSKYCNAIYLDIEKQSKLFKKFDKLWDHIPINSFARRNFADLYAYIHNYNIYIRIDDDNYPISNNFFDYHCKVGDFHTLTEVKSSNGWFNVCDLLIDQNKNSFYPRGYPYKFRWQSSTISSKKKYGKIDLMAGLWLGDPDIDAITRIHRPINAIKFNCKFGKNFFLNKRTNCSINTQNTSYTKELSAAFFVSPYAGRYDDIFSNYFLRRIMQHLNKNIVFGYPLVLQKRNIHNLWNDLNKEMIGNQSTEYIINLLESINFRSDNVVDCGFELIDNLKSKISYEKKYFKNLLDGLKIWLDVIKKI